MIIESIINWAMSTLTYAISLLPQNGNIFDEIPKISYTFLKYITLLNGYIPVNEFGTVLKLVIATYAVVYASRLIFAVYNRIVQLIP